MSSGPNNIATKYKTSPPPTRTQSPRGSVSSSASYPTSPTPLSYRSVSPLPTPVSYRTGCMSAAAKRYKYLRRLLKFQQMDFEFAAWQMFYLFVSPQKVYRNFQYRKQTKSQFARDDPAFIVLLCLWLCMTSVGFAVALKMSVFQFFRFVLYTVLVDTLAAGVVVATALWALSNHYLLKPTCREHDVEWGYAFDVHLNAFFPALVILHFVMLFFYSVFLSLDLFVSCLVSNLLWAVAIAYYVYITFLGYSCLPILHKTRLFLYTLPFLLFLLMISLAVGFNPSRALVHFYLERVL